MQKSIFFFLLAIHSLMGVSAQSIESNIDVLHYRFEIGLSDTSDTLTGKATLQLQFIHSGNEFSLDLTGLTEGKGMEVIRVTQDDKPVAYRQENDKLILHFNSNAAVGEKASFVISYKGIPADGLIISRNKYGHRTFFADNWPNRGHNWLPCNDVVFDKASVEFIITAPSHYQVVANGIQVEETNLAGDRKLTAWREEVPISTKVMVIGVADFAVNLSAMIDGCLPVYSWVYPENRDKGFYDYAQAADILPYFIKHVGPYGFKKLANVQSKTIFGGLENASTIFYAENSITGTRRSESLLVHEISHQWFGDMATEKNFSHLWLSEGFATYFTILYLQDRYGNDTATAMLKQDRDEVIAFARGSNKPVVDTTSDYMQLLDANSYQKGGWVLHMLHHQLGDSAFWKSIQLYYATYAGKTADTEDLEKIFEKVTGKDLHQFFQQWLYQPGLPQLQVSYAYNTSQKKLSLVVNQVQPNLFEFPLELDLELINGKSITKTITVSQASQAFDIMVSEKVRSITLDPSTALLFKGSVSEKR